MSRIFIGIPCYGNVAPEVLEDFMVFAYHCGRRLPQHDFFLGIKSKSEQFRARNTIVEAAQQIGADYLLMLDDDMIIDSFRESTRASEAYNLVEKLIAHDKDVIGALYYQRAGNCSPVLMKATGPRGYRFLRDDEILHRLQPVDVAGGGCLLIKMRVFDKIMQPYFEPEFEFGTDVQLCRKAAEKGFTVFADTSIELGHVRQERVVVTSRNRSAFVNDNVPGEIKKFVATDVYDRLVADAVEFTRYANVEEMQQVAFRFMNERKDFDGTDAEWYRTHGRERVARQVWFNSTDHKRQMTEFILTAVDHKTPKKILDFGCGIGIPAFTLAEKGHRVTAVDIDGTGTYEFLKYRAQKHKLNIDFRPSLGGELPNLGQEKYDVIVAMDCLEHLPNWPSVLAKLSDALRPDGVLFANNAILDDKTHPEHYDLEPEQFLEACVKQHLMPINQITYIKKVREAVGV